MILNTTDLKKNNLAYPCFFMPTDWSKSSKKHINGIKIINILFGWGGQINTLFFCTDFKVLLKLNALDEPSNLKNTFFFLKEKIIFFN